MPDSDRPPPDWIALDDWDETETPPQDWTVKDRIPRRQVTLFTGEGGTGKSTIGLHLCCAHVLGKDCLTTLPEQGPAFFLDAEDELSVVRIRLDAIRRHYGTTFGELRQSGLYVLSLAGKDAVLATVAKNGLIVPTDLYQWILKQAVEVKPQTIVVASAANVFTGSEIDRSQVTQFINLLTRLAIAANGSVILIAHPSLAGMANDSGLSGSTGWHNAVRARMYLHGAKANGAEAPDKDLKLLEFRKNQYGPAAASVSLKWRDGLFLPEGGPDRYEAAMAAAGDEHVFADLIGRYNRDGHAVSSDPKARNFAPKLFAAEPEAIAAKVGKAALHAAMRRLFTTGKLKNIAYGKASNPHQRIDINN